MRTAAEVDDLADLTRGPAPWSPTPDERVVVYGAGGFARSVLRAVRQAGANVPCALDRRGASAGGLDDLPVFAPGDEPIPRDQRALATAVVAVFNREGDIEAIERLLHSLGYGRVVGVPELYESFGPRLGERFWLAPRAFYATHQARIAAAEDVWADDESRNLFRSLIRFRVRWDTPSAPRPNSGMQYFPNDVPRGRAPMRFVDCGAFVGDTLSALARQGTSVEQVFAFEPDSRHFNRLVATAREFGRATSAEVSLWPCAVGGRTGTCRFRSDNGEAGRVDENGDVAVTVLALDDALPAAMPTDLKMDIEGAELDALRGAEQLIRRAIPRLAVCVYHRPEHLWEIPLYVRALGLPYDLFLRSHGHLGFDIVLYAVPAHDKSPLFERVSP
jgi:FkbM family methyltransferase